MYIVNVHWCCALLFNWLRLSIALRKSYCWSVCGGTKQVAYFWIRWWSVDLISVDRLLPKALHYFRHYKREISLFQFKDFEALKWIKAIFWSSRASMRNIDWLNYYTIIIFIIFQPNISIQWEDWVDTLSGIYQYHLEIRKMVLGSHGDQLTELYSEDPIYNGYTESGESVSLPTPGLNLVYLIYWCILSVSL